MTFDQSTLPNHACFLTVSIPCGPAPSRCNVQPATLVVTQSLAIQ
jgi:hypothetical protein